MGKFGRNCIFIYFIVVFSFTNHVIHFFIDNDYFLSSLLFSILGAQVA